jgi:hypothetical protein
MGNANRQAHCSANHHARRSSASDNRIVHEASSLIVTANSCGDTGPLASSDIDPALVHSAYSSILNTLRSLEVGLCPLNVNSSSSLSLVENARLSVNNQLSIFQATPNAVIADPCTAADPSVPSCLHERDVTDSASPSFFQDSIHDLYMRTERSILEAIEFEDTLSTHSTDLGLKMSPKASSF